MAGEKTASWTLDIKADGKTAASAAGDLEKFRSAIASSQDAVKQYSASLRGLRGTSDEVTSARAALKAKIDAERDAISRNNLEILKLGTTYEALSKKSKTVAGGTEDVSKALSAVGGPLSEAKEKFDSIKGVLGGVNPLMALTVAGLALVTLAFAALTGAVVGGTIALAKFVVESGNVLRAQGLLREAATGSAEDAERFGHQIDFLSSKLATPRDKLNELGVSIRKSFDGTQLSGQGIVDTITAVASASAAGAEESGRALQGILDRAKRFGRVQINPFELQGTGGPKFAEIAAALAKNTKVGVDKAAAALRDGLVPIDAAAAAIKDAVEARFGAVNAKKLLDLDVVMAKFHENLVGLTRGAGPALEPIFAGLKKMADLFSQNTVEGQALQSAITSFATVLSAVFVAGLPKGIALIDQLIIGALKFSIAMIDTAQTVVDFAHSTAGIATINFALGAIKATAIGVGVVFAILAGVIVGAFAIVGATFLAIGETISNLYTVGKAVWDAFKGIDWAGLGTAIIEGIKSGIAAAIGGLESAVTAVATSVKNAFTGALGIKSPSTVFAGYGRQTTAGYAQGLNQSAPDAQDAVTSMVESPGSPGAGGAPGRAGADGGGAGAGGGGAPHVSVVFQISGTGSPEKTAELMQQPSVLDAITRAIEIAARSLGVPTQTPVGA